MSSHHGSHFQPPPPIRTGTSDSNRSLSSGAMSPGSDMGSPTSPYSRSPRSPTSPAEQSFFGAITSRVRGRSRSGSRQRTERKRSKSPMVMPPEYFPPSSNAQPISPTYAPAHPQQPRHVSVGSQSSMASNASKPSRPSIQGPQRRSTSSSDPWVGRHSNSWLFNDFSIREHTKDFLHMGRKT